MLAPPRPSAAPAAPQGPLQLIVGSARHALVGVALISALVNVLYLTGSFFMLEVYDRVIPSRSIPTLVGLGALALVLYAFQGVLEALRSRLLVRVGVALDERLSGRIFALSLKAPLSGVSAAESGLMLRDLDQVRMFLSGTGPAAFFDLPWLPLYVAICFLFHPLIGVAAIAGALVLVTLTLVTELATRAPTKAATSHGVQRHALSEASRRNAEAVAAMGLEDALCRRFETVNRGYIDAQQRTADVGGGLGAISKVWRMALQSAVLALGAYLVIQSEATSGIIIASSILVSRALAPAELAIANWKGFVAARESWGRLCALVARMPETPPRLGLPAPSKTMTVEGISLTPPAQGRLVVQDLTFGLKAGQALGVIGASASGKSSLVRALVGVWRPVRGVVRLDGAALDQWRAVDLGRHIGYLPQEAELFAGTVGENIARFDARATSDAVIAAARAAGVHELILRLPDGYDTMLGEAGAGLSAGQRQRIGLARALYREPFLVVLDEPNANLDQEGEHALTQAILGIRARGGICVVVAHRPSALSAVDLLLTMADGRAQAFGPKEAVLKNRLRPISVDAVAPPPSSPPQPAPRILEPALQESA